MSEVELSEAPPGGYKVSLPTFEGPLDLLLHLCQKHELDILDIPIAFVTEKYLEYLAVMQLLDLDLASEYLVMAATLAHIKSKQLLPAPPPGQEDEAAGEEEDPREALIRRLLEYQKYKQAAADLVSRGIAGSDVFLRGMKLEEAVQTGLPPLANVPLFSLVEAFQGVLSKSKVRLTHDIVHERMTLTDRINELVDVLRVKKRVQFEELFEGQTTRFDLVITFLALLEMTKLRMTRLFQADPFAPIFVEFAAQVTGDEDPLASAVIPEGPDAPFQAMNAPEEAEDEGEDAPLDTDPDLDSQIAEEAARERGELPEHEGEDAATLTEPPGEDTEWMRDDSAVVELDDATVEEPARGPNDTMYAPAPAPEDTFETIPPAAEPMEEPREADPRAPVTSFDTERPPASAEGMLEEGSDDPRAKAADGDEVPSSEDDDREQT